VFACWAHRLALKVRAISERIDMPFGGRLVSPPGEYDGLMCAAVALRLAAIITVATCYLFNVAKQAKKTTFM